MKEGQALLGLRVFLGLLLLAAGYWKLRNPSFEANVESVLMGWANTNPLFWYQDLMRWLIIPNAHVLGRTLGWIESATGLCIIVGLFTPRALQVAGLLLLNYGLATHHLGAAWAGFHASLLVLCAALGWAQAGEIFGVDGWWKNRPVTPTTSSPPPSKKRSSPKVMPLKKREPTGKAP